MIARITQAAVHGPDDAQILYHEAISAATMLNLPHQLQRIVRATKSPTLGEIREEAQSKLSELKVDQSAIAPTETTRKGSEK